jgi:hypothetical protein
MQNPSEAEGRFARGRWKVIEPIHVRIMVFVTQEKIIQADLKNLHNRASGSLTVRGELFGLQLTYPKPDSAEIWKLQVLVVPTEDWRTTIQIKTTDRVDETFEEEKGLDELSERALVRVNELLKSLPR